MRISGGILKGMPIVSPGGQGTRPTSAKVREAVMSALLPSMNGAAILDICAGSGAFSLEALSRGADSALLVESERKALRCIKENLAEAERRLRQQGGKPWHTRIVGRDFFKSVEQLFSAGPFNIIWVDPPYVKAMDFVQCIVEELTSKQAIACELVVESDKKDCDSLASYIAQQVGFSLAKQRVYGNSAIHRIEYAGRGD